jgi:N-acetyl-gamma-glutamylphosphate reductase
MTVRWGVAGPGPVADKVMRDLVHVPDAVLTAVGSRSAERAAAFAAGHAAAAGRGQVPTAHGSYQALLGAPDVDVVYVATPHPSHRALALAALAAGKAVLVEPAGDRRTRRAAVNTGPVEASRHRYRIEERHPCVFSSRAAPVRSAARSSRCWSAPGTR